LEALEKAQTNASGLIEVTGLISYVDDKVPDVSYQAFHQHQPQNKMLGSNFAIARPTAMALQTALAATVAPTKPTHVVIAPTIEVFESIAAASTKGVAVEKLNIGTAVVILKSANGWDLIARDGKPLGYGVSRRVSSLPEPLKESDTP
jgi:hypothetical protein